MRRLLTDKIDGQVAPGSGTPIAMIVREPLGAAALALPTTDAGAEDQPALAAACSVIVNPALETSETTLRRAERPRHRPGHLREQPARRGPSSRSWRANQSLLNSCAGTR